MPQLLSFLPKAKRNLQASNKKPLVHESIWVQSHQAPGLFFCCLLLILFLETSKHHLFPCKQARNVSFVLFSQQTTRDALFTVLSQITTNRVVDVFACLEQHAIAAWKHLFACLVKLSSMQ
mmetsp:Transcript_6563/g.11584  ORF Transcript_6563/g.11584 Transcript_6563/m.11584 type:complete len:121 (+) Transcript_6563:3676-4038(+)